MDPVTGEHEQLAHIHEQTAETFAKQGGVLRCAVCGHSQPLGTAQEIAGYLARGDWPEHCEQTMIWIARDAADPAAWPDLPPRIVPERRPGPGRPRKRGTG
jgi:hypothetical protein